MKIVFVVLHYKIYSITKECIDYLLKQKYEDISVIVVDNCSDNGSVEMLKKEYNDKVYFVDIEDNVGFAKANDLGYQIAKHKYGADCIVIINNDLFIEDKLFCSKLADIYQEDKFDILGPDIINNSGKHQNPLSNCVIGESDLNRLIFKTRIKLALLPFFYCFKRVGDKEIDYNDFTFEKQRGVPLHGSCLIFGTSFIRNNEYPFYPETFLYGEEDILYYRSMQSNKKVIFDPSLKVRHIEDASTDSISKNRKEKRSFQLRNSLHSLLILKKLMKKGK